MGVYFDQDMFIPGANDDRDYTMGIGVEVFQDQGPLYLMGGLLKWLDPVVGFDRRCGRAYRSFLLGAVAYTTISAIRRLSSTTDPTPPCCISRTNAWWPTTGMPSAWKSWWVPLG